MNVSPAEGCRGQGATDVLPRDARGVAVPYGEVVSRLVVSARVTVAEAECAAASSRRIERVKDLVRRDR